MGRALSKISEVALLWVAAAVPVDEKSFQCRIVSADLSNLYLFCAVVKKKKNVTLTLTKNLTSGKEFDKNID